MNTINYASIAQALEFYEALGYKQIEVPWRVSIDTINITKPATVKKDDYIIAGTGKALLASGEQGLLYLANKGMLPFGKYQTVTPCFRNESYDRYHSKQFLKLELINLLDASQFVCGSECQELGHDMLKDAKKCMNELVKGLATKIVIESMMPEEHDELAVPGTRPMDLVITMRDGRQVEVGSYGVRRTSFGMWVYGTGVAEPRFTKTVQEVELFS